MNIVHLRVCCNQTTRGLKNKVMTFNVCVSICLHTCVCYCVYVYSCLNRFLCKLKISDCVQLKRLLCAPAVFLLKSTMLTAAAAAAKSFLSHNSFHSLLEVAFEVFSFVKLATSQLRHERRQATINTQTDTSLYIHYSGLYFSGVRRRRKKRQTQIDTLRKRETNQCEWE